jgi:hypothetical protein
MKRALLLLLWLARPSAADPAADRVAYLSRALTAVHTLGAGGRDRLELELYTAARTRCHADIACLAEAAAALCHGDPACEAAADVVAANTRAANDWVDEATRARLVRSSVDYRVALAGELHRRFAALAAELALAGGTDAAAIDRLCRERDRTLHACRDDDTTCVPSLPWSRCAAALVWFVGSTP